MSGSAHRRPLALPLGPSVDADALVTRLADELGRRWAGGERPRVEEYLDLHPHLWHNAEAAVELIYEEICLRRESGEEVSRDELLTRFPRWQQPLDVLLDCHHALEPAQAPSLPAIGEAYGEFQLLAELGRGGMGRVYLAAQRSLGDRLVVLKMTPRDGREHLSLARLQHTHVVPLYSARDDPARNLRVLCMPFFGSATLKHLLEAVARVPPHRRTGRHVLDAIDAAPCDPRLGPDARGPARRELARATYVQAICWLGARLAEALHYAHERGLVHLDIKPSNVLLGADAQPMLLDFHLARGPIHPDDPPPAWLGGTAAYMAPEQQAALDAVRAGLRVPGLVDGRSDIYSLGVVLYEALGGRVPATVGGSPLARHVNPAVSVGLSDIIAKCMAPRAEDRYLDAAALAADLQRFLVGQALRGVPNRSLRERWTQWRRRSPNALPLVGVCGLLLCTVLTAFAVATYQYRRQLADATLLMAEGDARLARDDDAGAIESFRRGASLCSDVPWSGADLHDRLAERLHAAEQHAAARQLHTLADLMRGQVACASEWGAGAASLEKDCSGFWQRREAILRQLCPPGGTLSPSIRTDLLDLIVLWTDLGVHSAPADQSERRRRAALAILDEAQRLFGQSPVLWQARAVHARALGDSPLAQVAEAALRQHPPRSAWEWSALGVAELRHGEFQGAGAALNRALELAPGAFWPNFSHGVWAYRTAHYDRAVADFSVCIGASPRSADALHNRGLAYTALRTKDDEAFRDFDHALAVAPGRPEILLSRASLYERQGRYREARADLENALAQGGDPANVHYHLAIVEFSLGAPAAARDHVEQALRHDPHRSDALRLRQRLAGP